MNVQLPKGKGFLDQRSILHFSEKTVFNGISYVFALFSTALTAGTGPAGLCHNEFINKGVHPARCDRRNGLIPLWMTGDSNETLDLATCCPPWKQEVLRERRSAVVSTSSYS
jgi:hypothetical protein